MALQEQAVSIPILAMNQKSSEVSGPVGRLKRLVNAVVDKYDADGSNLRIAKRPAFRAMTRTLADPYGNGGAGGPGIPSPSVVDTLRNQLFAIGSDTAPYIYSAAANAWQKFYEETILTNSVALTPIWSKSTQIQCPDSATAGSSHCYVWQQDGNCWCIVLDDEGTVIRSYFQVGAGGRVKVVSDGNRFLLFTDNGTTTVTVFGLTPTGDLIPSTTATTLFRAGDSWDVTYQSDAIGMTLIRRGTLDSTGNTGATTVQLTVSGFTITPTANYTTGVTWGHDDSANDMGGAIITNKTGNGYLYVATLTSADFTTGYTLNVAKLDTTATVAHTYIPISGSSIPGFGITNIAGFVTSSRVYALASHLPYTGSAPVSNFASNALTEVGYATSSTDGLGYKIVRSAQIASRVAFVSGVPVVFAYYASVPSWYSTLGFGQSGQPTFFLLRADTGAVVGRVMHGTAAEDWTWTTWDGLTVPMPNSFQLPTPRTTVAGITVSLGQTGAQQVNVGSAGIIAVDNFVSTVGITDVTLGAPGTCVELDHETLIPGPLARSFDGVSFSASGIELGPEQPNVTDSGTSGGMNGGEIYGFVIVYERMDRAGRKVRSASSGSVQYVVPGSGSNRSASLTIPTLRLTTHDDVIISVFRTLWEDGQQGTTHHKITNDLSPLLNDPTVDTITFVDSVSNQQASVGEVLYGGSGAVPATEGGGDGQEVDHDPPPPFSSGCVFQDRAFVNGPASVAFSLPGSASSPFAFSEGFSMTVPSHDEVVGVVALDARLVFLCSGSFWFANADTFLDATGAGDIPTPQQLPITHGCTGVFAVIPEGVVYASSSGGFYLLPRDLGEPVYIGAAVEDEMVGATVTSIASDGNNRVYFLTSTNLILVFDLNSKCWLIWTPPTTAKVLAVWKGQLVYTDGTDVFVLTPGTYADNPGAVDQPIITTIEFEAMSFADVQMFWDLDVFVSGGSDYSLTATAFYDLDTSEPDVFPTFDAGTMDVDGSGHARYNLPITNPECTYLSLSLTDSFPSGPGAGFILEKLVAAVGVIPGKRRNNLNQRVQA